MSKDKKSLNFTLDKAADFGFRPLTKDHSGNICLDTSTHQVNIHYQANSDEYSWQLYHLQNAIEPL